MSKEEIMYNLEDIFFNVMHMDKNHLTGQYMDKDLFGYAINFAPRDLLFLFFEIEKRFNIIIPNDDILNNEFNTINNIANIIYREKQAS